jgi:hypothetical protein
MSEVVTHPGPFCPCADCQQVWKLLGVLHESRHARIVLDGDGICRRCGFREDLRMGVCFRCSDFTAGQNLGDGFHELWDRDNPENRWLISL